MVQVEPLLLELSTSAWTSSTPFSSPCASHPSLQTYSGSCLLRRQTACSPGTCPWFYSDHSAISCHKRTPANYIYKTHVGTSLHPRSYHGSCCAQPGRPAAHMSYQTVAPTKGGRDLPLVHHDSYFQPRDTMLSNATSDMLVDDEIVLVEVRRWSH